MAKYDESYLRERVEETTLPSEWFHYPKGDIREIVAAKALRIPPEAVTFTTNPDKKWRPAHFTAWCDNHIWSFKDSYTVGRGEIHRPGHEKVPKEYAQMMVRRPAVYASIEEAENSLRNEISSGDDLAEETLEKFQRFKPIANDITVEGGEVDVDDIRRGTRLAGKQITDAQLAGVDLADTYLHDITLSEADLRFADLSEADLSQADIAATQLDGANLGHADLSETEIADTSLQGVRLTDADFSNTDIRGVDFTGADLDGADFSNASLVNVDFTGAIVYDVDFTGATFTDVTFHDTKDVYTGRKPALILGTDFSEAVFSTVSFETGIGFYKCDLVNVEGKNVDFKGAVFEKTSLEKSTLQEADFSEAYFGRGVSLACADVSDASFADSTLSHLDLSSTVVDGVDLAGAEIDDANFADAVKYHRVKNIPEEADQLDTYWPDPDSIQSVMQDYGLKSARLFHTPYSVTDEGPPPSDTTMVHRLEGDVVAIKNPDNLQQHYHDGYPLVDRQVPTTCKPFLRIPFDALDDPPNPEAVPPGMWVDTVPFADSFLKADVAIDEESEELTWMTQEEYIEFQP